MKYFSIIDDYIDTNIGYIVYFEKSKKFVIELQDGLNLWDTPLLFRECARNGVLSIPSHLSYEWVRGRIIPPSRQNIGSILKKHSLVEYNEIDFLELSKGYSSQDECHIEKIDYKDIPESIRKRELNLIKECYLTNDESLIIIFNNNVYKKIKLVDLCIYDEKIKYMLNNKDFLQTIKVGAGGYCININDSIDIQASDLFKFFSEEITSEDLYNFSKNNLISSSDAAKYLDCTRQNLSYLIKNRQIKPILLGKENFFTKGDIERLKND